MTLGAEYRKLWAANAISNLGDGIMFVAAPLLATILTKDPVQVAGLTVANTLSRTLFALFSGALADRLDRRLAIVLVDIFQAALLGFLGIVVLGGWANIPLLYVIFFLMGAAQTLADTAAPALLPDVVPKKHLERANSWFATTQLVADEFVGPPLGGLLFATAAAIPFFLNGASFAAAAAFMLAMRGTFQAERAEDSLRTTLVHEVGEGISWLLQHRLLRVLAVTLGTTSVAYAFTFPILVLFAREVLGLDAAGYGLLLAFSSIGGLAGAAVAGRCSRWLGSGWTIFGALLLGAASYVGIALSANPYFVGVMLALYIFHVTVYNVIEVSLRQSIAPRRVLGRVSSAYLMLGLVGMALGALLGGLLARNFGLTTPFWVGALVLAGTALLALPAVNNKTIAKALSERPNPSA